MIKTPNWELSGAIRIGVLSFKASKHTLVFGLWSIHRPSISTSRHAPVTRFLMQLTCQRKKVSKTDFLEVFDTWQLCKHVSRISISLQTTQRSHLKENNITSKTHSSKHHQPSTKMRFLTIAFSVALASLPTIFAAPVRPPKRITNHAKLHNHRQLSQ